MYMYGRYYHALAVNLTSNLAGMLACPSSFCMGISSPCFFSTVYLCRTPVKNLYSSILAKVSPRHLRLPTPNGITWGLGSKLPSLTMYREGSNFSGSGKCSGSVRTALRKGTTWVPLGMKYPARLVSLRVMCPTPLGTMSPHLWTSCRAASSRLYSIIPNIFFNQNETYVVAE